MHFDASCAERKQSLRPVCRGSRRLSGRRPGDQRVGERDARPGSRFGLRVRTAVDTNVISALWSCEPLAGQMAELLEQGQAAGALIIAAPVYAELLAYPRADESFIKRFLAETDIRVDFALAEGVWSRAGEAFSSYAARRRASGAGEPRRLLVDFVIGAHAGLESDRLLTLDPSRYRRDFPTLNLMEIPR